ncbi:DNA topoisomerase, type IA, central domain-containing protein [Rozella allomycis CSF55]|uniref:DNA topoisomerase n=1 Tax=Rozella allomycis (strain CSF55) TaxID=988480 RepID=A0A075AT24_ROZAC|nr:DNA topoisomerase, type IA, central domain-containing protein [Rozella allomycis CSF55]|eukprot:EPZ33325.1 DNA topoisomerase, type IA, central domain-containing protein [Rozella allomycis CSF55]
MSPSDANKLLALTNQHRASLGLNALQLDSKLTAAAEGHSNAQAQAKTMGHFGFENRMATCGFPGSDWAENVGMTQRRPIDVAFMHQMWLDSPGHRRNIEKVGLTHVGFGLAANPDGDYLFYTEFFSAISSGSKYKGTQPQVQQPSSYQGSPSNGHRSLYDTSTGAGAPTTKKGCKNSIKSGAGIPQIPNASTQNTSTPNTSTPNTSTPNTSTQNTGTQSPDGNSGDQHSAPSLESLIKDTLGDLMNGDYSNSQTQDSSDPNAHQTQYSKKTYKINNSGQGGPNVTVYQFFIISNGGKDSGERKGVDKYCNNFDFIVYQQRNQMQCEMTMTSVLGHVMEYAFPDETKSWTGYPVENMFSIPIVKKVHPDKERIKVNLERESRKAEWLIIWTDCDREGENIGMEISEICRRANPRLLVYRARFSVVNGRELKNSFENLSQIDVNMSMAVDTRQELDLRIGAAFTRLQTINLQSKFKSLEKTVISYGPCQFPTLGFIVDQYRKNKDFVSECFWSLTATLEKENKNCVCSWARGSIFDERVVELYKTICQRSPIARIMKVDEKATKKYRPLPLTTVEFQKFGTRYLKMSSHKLMNIAEKLYNRGIISYPRTETDVFENGIDLKGLIQKHCDNEIWGNYCQGLMQGSFMFPRKGKHNDKAHPPIHPTMNVNNLEGEEFKVYEFITRRFLACCSKDALGVETKVEIKIADETFACSGLLITERNYLEIYIYDKWNENSLPKLIVGEEIKAKISKTNGKTTAPPLLTEGDLIGLMDKNGIGTDATIHDHIKKIQDRNYAKKTSKGFIPTPLGLSLVEGYDAYNFDHSLTKPQLRALMESEMNNVCQGLKSKNQVLEQGINLYFNLFIKTKNSINLLLQKVSENLNQEISEDDHVEINRHSNYVQPSNNSNSNYVQPSNSNSSSSYVQPSNSFSSNTSNTFSSNSSNSVQPSNNSTSNSSNSFNPSNTSNSYNPSNPSLEQNTNSPPCSCGLNSFLFTVKKQGPNLGKKFYSCSKPQNEKCDFFQWLDPPIDQSAPQRSVDDFGSSISCNCNKIVQLKTVQKSGPNYGKKFYSCSTCDFFLWSLNDSSHSQSIQEAIKCDCGLESVSFTCQKPPNNGRKFFKCPKQSGMKCSFFQWADEHSTTRVDHSTRVNYNSRDSSNTWDNANTWDNNNSRVNQYNSRSNHNSSNTNSYNSNANVDCFLCKRGHFANNCPSKKRRQNH